MVSVCVWKNANKKGPITIPLTVHLLFNKITWLAAAKQCLVNNYYTITIAVIYVSQHVELFTRLQSMPENQCLILVVRNLLQAWCENEISIMLEYFYEESKAHYVSLPVLPRRLFAKSRVLFSL